MRVVEVRGAAARKRAVLRALLAAARESLAAKTAVHYACNKFVGICPEAVVGDSIVIDHQEIALAVFGQWTLKEEL